MLKVFPPRTPAPMWSWPPGHSNWRTWSHFIILHSPVWQAPWGQQSQPHSQLYFQKLRQYLAQTSHLKHVPFEFIPTTTQFRPSSSQCLLAGSSFQTLLTCLPGFDFSPFQALFHAAATGIFQTFGSSIILVMPMSNRSTEDSNQTS